MILWGTSGISGRSEVGWFGGWGQRPASNITSGTPRSTPKSMKNMFQVENSVQSVNFGFRLLGFLGLPEGIVRKLSRKNV